MVQLYKVTFKYRDIDAFKDDLGILTSKFVEKTKMFFAKDEISAYVSRHATIIQHGKSLSLLYYVVEQYALVKEKEYSVNIKSANQ